MDQSPLGWTLFELAEIVGGELHGPPDLRITHPVPAGEGGTEGITFAESSKYLELVEATDVGAVLVSFDTEGCSKPYIKCQFPRQAFGRILAIAWRELPLDEGVHSTALVAESAKIDPHARVGAYCVIEDGARVMSGARIYPFCYIGANCVVGESCRIYPQVSLYRDVTVGDRSSVHSGTVLGADGFGYFWDGERHRKVPQVGGVRIGEDCEIGALTAVDRATAGSTNIGNGVKIDNLVQIAHNVFVGQDSVIAGQTGISGSTRVGARNTFAGKVGLKDHITTADDVTIAAGTAVTSDIDQPGAYWGNLVARPLSLEKRIQVALGELPELVKRVRHLEAEIEKLRAKS
ncbi:MAG TPA: UDP-3-O-(3-hydroxymyristoyl)glucosamine N-acyltransferase [Fimbriimonadales bacterium]|nr:UDP-3-O-(3-hydroxymyristoyl)glucosamine N-acyltransferase [Fimbriimonadales bacterium]